MEKVKKNLTIGLKINKDIKQYLILEHGWENRYSERKKGKNRLMEKGNETRQKNLHIE